jgi:hypothetical protein
MPEFVQMGRLSGQQWLKWRIIVEVDVWNDWLVTPLLHALMVRKSNKSRARQHHVAEYNNHPLPRSD